jgi:hypothetical protein
MANEYVDIALLRVIRKSGGKIDCEDIVDFKPTVTTEKKVVNTMNRKRIARGYTASTTAITWEITVPLRKEKPEFDWRRAARENEVFDLVVEEADGGRRRTYVDCVANECSPEFQEAGETRMTVSGLALDEEYDRDADV